MCVYHTSLQFSRGHPRNLCHRTDSYSVIPLPFSQSLSHWMVGSRCIPASYVFVAAADETPSRTIHNTPQASIFSHRKYDYHSFRHHSSLGSFEEQKWQTRVLLYPPSHRAQGRMWTDKARTSSQICIIMVEGDLMRDARRIRPEKRGGIEQMAHRTLFWINIYCLDFVRRWTTRRPAVCRLFVMARAWDNPNPERRSWEWGGANVNWPKNWNEKNSTTHPGDEIGTDSKSKQKSFLSGSGSLVLREVHNGILGEEDESS